LKTVLHPWSPKVVLDQLKPPIDSRPQLASSSSSISKIDARKSRKLVKEVGTIVGKRTNKKAGKLMDLVNRLHLENDVLRYENSNLKDILHLEKRRRRKGKGLK
jgi:hypothetical protein